MGVVQTHVEVAALLWAIVGEGCDEEVSPQGHSLSSKLDVTLPVIRARQEVKDGPILQDVIRMRREVCLRHIRPEPPAGLGETGRCCWCCKI